MAGNACGALKRCAALTGLSVDEYAARRARGEKWCYACREWRSTSEFQIDRSRGDGLSALCGSCRATRARSRYVAKPRVSRIGIAMVPARDGDRRQARARVNHQIEIGLRPAANSLPCVDCGDVWADGKPRHEYDHHLGYSPEHQLAVEPVCRRCHVRRTWDRRGTCRRGHRLQLGVPCVLCRRIRENKNRDAAWWRARRLRRKERAANGS